MQQPEHFESGNFQQRSSLSTSPLVGNSLGSEALWLLGIDSTGSGSAPMLEANLEPLNLSSLDLENSPVLEVLGSSLVNWFTSEGNGEDTLITQGADPLLGSSFSVSAEAASFLAPIAEEAQLKEQGQILDLSGASNTSRVLEPAIALVQESLANFALSPNFSTSIATAFGEGASAQQALSVINNWLAGQGSIELEILARGELNSSAAFNSATNTIYLDSAFVESNASEPEIIASVVLEELGHYLDSQLNHEDAPGDEGAIFAALVRGDSLESRQLAALKVEDDSTTINRNGQNYLIEQSGLSMGEGLTGYYFDNKNFTNLKLIRTDAEVAFNWQGESPDPALEPNRFSVRWSGQVEALHSETYTFYTGSNDGVRLWVDGQLLIDNWTDHTYTEDSGTINLIAGQKYDIKLEYYDKTGNAVSALYWESASRDKEIIPQSQLYPETQPSQGRGSGLKGQYFDNKNFTNLKLTRTDAAIDFNWVDGSPDPQIQADTFSVRWSGQVEALYDEEYTFYTTSDDGVRLWVNGQLLIDNWTDHAVVENSGSIVLAAGQKYDIQLEYYENFTYSSVQLGWSSSTQPKEIIPTALLYPLQKSEMGMALSVPGATGQRVSATISVSNRDASTSNEWGIFRVDDEFGRIGNLDPDDPGYAAAALAPERIAATLTNNQTQTSVELESNSYLGTYLIRGGTTSAFLSQNSDNQLGDAPVAFFSFLGANADSFEHLQSSLESDTQWQLAWEEGINGGDGDFNDLVINIELGTPSVELIESSNFVIEDSRVIELGQSEGSRTLSFDLNPQFDTTDSDGLIEDQLLVYLVDSANPSQTLLGRIDADGTVQQGSALFSLAGDRAEYTPGLVRFDGTTVEIDLTSLGNQTEGLLVFQLLNHDGDTGSSIGISNISNRLDPTGSERPLVPENLEGQNPGAQLEINQLSDAASLSNVNLDLKLSQVRFDGNTGQYTAQLQVQHLGSNPSDPSPEPFNYRQLAVVFPNLPAGVELLNRSGVDSAGNPYLNFSDAIPPEGIEKSRFSEALEISFANPNLVPIDLAAQILVGEVNQAPVFEPVGNLSVTPGSSLEIPLIASDANGDRVTFTLIPDGEMPTGSLRGDGSLIFTPRPDQIGSYSFTLIASDGVSQTQQNVTLEVVPDPLATTRISGQVLDTQGQPLAGVPIEIGRIFSFTDSNGYFTLELPPELVPTSSFDLEIPQGDPQFDPYNTGTETIEFRRAQFDSATGNSLNNPRRHPNLVSSFLDGSMVYGSDSERASALRTLDGTGKLKTSSGDLLPFNSSAYFPDGPLENGNANGDPTSLFVAGDVRGSENVALASLHTIFLREHNRLASEIAAHDPTLDGDTIYYQARRLVTAQIQHIHYNEYLPLLLGQSTIAPYSGYNPSVDPSISAAFATAAFRIGHSQSSATILRLDENGNPLADELTLAEAFFTTEPIVDDGIDPILRGLSVQQAQEVDTKVIDQLRNFLFGPPGAGGMDLVSIGIQRGRDLGLPSYNQARLDYGLTPATSFADITSDTEVQAALANLYGSVDNLDLWVGGLAEDHVPGAMVGSLFAEIIGDQFERLRDGDRFWYENNQFTSDELNFIRTTSLADLIERNTSISNLSGSVFTTGTTPGGITPGGGAASSAATEYASFDGTGNNLTNPELGSSGEYLGIDFTLDYGDGISTPAGADRPEARQISNGLFDQQGDIFNSVGATAMTVFWGQLIAHDLSHTPTGISNTLKVYGDQYPDPNNQEFPFVAEKLPLMLGHEVYEGFNNVIERPIYLPVLDTANAVTIDPNSETIVSVPVLEDAGDAQVIVAAGSLFDQQGNPYTGELSISYVPSELTPAALPKHLSPDLVVTIQPGEMVFREPAKLTLPNSAGYAAGLEMDLWSINPETGDFEIVGQGRVSDDGSVIETIEGGIRNSSWHLFAPPVNIDPVLNPDERCDECKQSVPFNSEVELHSGAVIENHNLVGYESNGVTRFVSLVYDSLRADPRPIVHFGSDSGARGFEYFIADLSFSQGDFNYQVPGYQGSKYGLEGGEHFFGTGGSASNAALQADLSQAASGKYEYHLTAGFYTLAPPPRPRGSGGSSSGAALIPPRLTGSSSTFIGSVLHVNSTESPFGSGWGIAGWQQLVESSDGSLLLIDGDGSELLFEAPSAIEGDYLSPPGDFSTLERLADGTFVRTTKEQMVYTFNSSNQLASVRDRNGNETRYLYNTSGQLSSIIDPVGLATNFSYNSLGRVASITDPAGRVTQLDYDSFGNLIRVTDPDNTTRNWRYDSRHHMIEEIDQRGNKEQAFYNFAGRAESAIRKDGSQVRVNPLQGQGLARPEDTLDPDLTKAVTVAASEEAGYINGNGEVVLSELDSAGQLVSRTDGVGNSSSTERNGENQVTFRADARGNFTRYQYDERGNLTTIFYSGNQLFASDNFDEYDQVGNGITDVVTGDLNNDGNPDLVTANQDSNSVSILLGDGNGNFSPLNAADNNIIVGASPESVVLADLNNDGELDLVTANASDNSVSVLLNNGLSFNRSDYTVGNNPVSIAVGDLNNDGQLDLVSANRGDEEILDDSSASVLLNLGNGTFNSQPDSSFAVGESPVSVALGDFNSDLVLDLVAASADEGKVSLLSGNGDGTFSLQSELVVGANLSSMSIGDLDSDGQLDLLVTNLGSLAIAGDERLSVLFGDGEGNLINRLSFASDNGLEIGAALGDLNGDGDLDLIEFDTGSATSTLSVRLNNGDGSFASDADFEFDWEFDSVALADTDADGDLDLIGALEAYSYLSVHTNLWENFGLRTFTYDPVFNQLESITDERGKQTFFEIDPLTGNTLSATRVIGQLDSESSEDNDIVTSYSYTAAGLIDLVTDPAGRVMDYDYDSFGRLIKITFAVGTPSEASQHFEYDSVGNLTAFIDENGNRTEYAYDILNNRLETIIEADPDGAGVLTSPITSFTYDEVGNLKTLTDPRNHTITYDYDTLNRVVTITDPDPDGAAGSLTSLVTNYEYDESGNLAVVKESYQQDNQLISRQREYEYDPRGRLISTIDPEGGITDYSYDLDNNLTSITNSLGHESKFEYDIRNRLLRETDAAGQVTRYNYDATNNLVAVTDRNQNTTRFFYDDAGRLSRSFNPFLDEISYLYDDAGNLIAQTDAEGRTTEYEYDSRNRLTSIVTPLQNLAPGETNEITYTYDAVGNLTSITDQLYRTTSYSYDGLNRLISTSDPLNRTTSYEYDLANNLTAMVDELGHRSQLSYDARGRLTSEVNPLGDSVSYTYNGFGNLIAFTDELNRTTEYTYDQRNWRTGITDPEQNTTTLEYDANGNLISVIDANGNLTSYNYDQLNRQIGITDALNQTTSFTYDPEGNLLSITDPLENATSYSYDKLNRLVTDTNELGKSRSYSYDKVGNLTTATDRNGRVRQFNYDELDRRTTEIWLDELNNPIRTINYEYDAASQLQAISDPDSVYDYDYDAAGRLLYVDNTGTPGVPEVRLDYNYDTYTDSQGRLNYVVNLTDSVNGQLGGSQASYYDPLNRLVSITQTGNGVSDKRVDLSYDQAGQLDLVKRYSDLGGTQLVAQSDYNYDSAGRLTDLSHSQGNTTFASYNWTYDPGNRITSFSSPDGTSIYSYDEGNQLTATDHSYQADETYSYDENGNRTNSGYQTQTNNRLVSDGTYTYLYDDEGNRTGRTEIATGEVTQYQWDYRNRLTGVITFDSAGNTIEQIEYTYDALDRRLAKSVDLDGDGAAQPEIERYIYNGEHIYLVFDEQGNQTQRFLHGEVVDQVFAQEDENGAVLWALTDNLGTVRDVIDSQGNVENHIVYDSFGNVVSETDANVEFRFGYTGREFDSETGQYYYRARYYDATVGRFISEDPIGFAAGDSNLSRYVGNSPINATDPSGNVAIVDDLVFLTAIGVLAIGGLAIHQINKLTEDIEDYSDSAFDESDAKIDTRVDPSLDPNNINREKDYLLDLLSHTGHPADGLDLEPLGGFDLEDLSDLLNPPEPDCEDLFQPFFESSIDPSRGVGGTGESLAGDLTLDDLIPELSNRHTPLSFEIKHRNKHLPNTPQSNKLLRKGDAAHVFNDPETMSRVEAEILTRGEFLGNVRGTDRFGLRFEEPIGVRIAPDGTSTPLHFGEIKVSPNGQFHVVPRTRSAQ